jgi:proliferating cell nuclear antigen PCNA
MKIQISDKKKKEIFVSLFQTLKNCSSVITTKINSESLHIQGMDKSHVCLFDAKINSTWFNTFEITKDLNLSFDTSVFYSIISSKSDSQDLIIKMDEDNEDTMHIHFIPQEKEKENKKGELKGHDCFKKFFKMPLTEYDYDEMAIPTVDYDAEFSLSSKQISDMFSQLSNFGNDIIIKCSEQEISLTTNGFTGEMRVDIPIDDLSGYSIVEDEEIILTYSLSYINKMCITNKLSNDIEFSLSNNCPMKISYDLGDNSLLQFFMAPKMNE